VGTEGSELSALLVEEYATFERRDSIRAVAKAARQGTSLDGILDRVASYRTSPDAVEVEVGRWATQRILAAERSVLEVAAAEPSGRLQADAAAVEAAVASRPSLSREQRAMVEQLCLSGRPVDVVIGRAGAGRTFTLDAVREAFENFDHRVFGVSLAPRAARSCNRAQASRRRQRARYTPTSRPTDVGFVLAMSLSSTKQECSARS